MMRRITAIACCLWFAGCGGEPYRPAERDTSSEPPAQTTGEPLPTSGDSSGAMSGELDLGPLRLTAPDTWTRKQPRSSILMAEFSLPRAEGDEADGRLTVSTAGGTVKDNIERWRGQFGGSPEDESQEEIKVGDTTITVVDFTGTYNDQMGPMAPGVKREGYRMLGAIIPAGGQMVFIKAYGPKQTLANHADSFRAFLESLEVK